MHVFSTRINNVVLHDLCAVDDVFNLSLPNVFQPGLVLQHTQLAWLGATATQGSQLLSALATVLWARLPMLLSSRDLPWSQGVAGECLPCLPPGTEDGWTGVGSSPPSSFLFICFLQMATFPWLMKPNRPKPRLKSLPFVGFIMWILKTFQTTYKQEQSMFIGCRSIQNLLV